MISIQDYAFYAVLFTSLVLCCVVWVQGRRIRRMK